MEHGDFLSTAFIYLIAAVASVPIAKRLGLGSILGYLIAGVLIGPFGIGAVGDQTEMLHFAEFGVVMMLFLIGLELRPSLLWSMRSLILGAGLTQVVLSTAVLALISYFLVENFNQALALGLIFALSSTAIVLQSLGEKGLMKTPGGQTSFGILLLQDLAVIPIISLMPLLAIASIPSAGEAGGDSTLIKVFVPLVAVAALIVAGRYVVKPIFRFIAQSRLREVFTAAALLMIVAIALLMNLVGLSPALGAFVAGVVLAENEYRHEIESDLQPFKGLLMGLFFLGVGASVDFNLFAAEFKLILIAVGLLIVAKFLVLLAVGKICKLDKRSGLMAAFFLAQGGEFGFVLFEYARQSSVFDDRMVSIGILVVAVSMISAPLMMIIFEKLLAPRLEAQPENQSDDIEPEGPIIVAGFGRFGQIISRMLIAAGHHLTILDHDSEQIELVRRFGNKVFFGDASRLDLLRAAGASEAQLMVIAVDSIEKSMEMVRVAQKHFPNLPLAVRARNRQHAYELIRSGVRVFERDTFRSAISLGVDALQQLGMDEKQAIQAGERFTKHDRQALKELSELWGDEKAYGTAVRKNMEELKLILESDEDYLTEREEEPAATAG